MHVFSLRRSTLRTFKEDISVSKLIQNHFVTSMICFYALTGLVTREDETEFMTTGDLSFGRELLQMFVISVIDRNKTCATII